METMMTHHRPTLAIAGALSTLVALLGAFVHVQQSRARRLAMQRVSFVNRVSHELRTPLTNMLLNLDVIEHLLPANSRAGSRLVMVREEARRLARLIDNVLTFSRREQGALKVHAVECRPCGIVDDVLAHFAPGFARRDIAVTRRHDGGDASCLLDADALSQITANLLSNVEKYAPGVPVEVCTFQDNARFKLRVCDEGPGIPATDAGQIFQPFVRLDDRVTANATGTGLGLSIARELAERMGGSLRLERRETGACFVLEVPFASVLQKEEDPVVSSAPVDPLPP
jgi:signal transduction histidine kinase